MDEKAPCGAVNKAWRVLFPRHSDLRRGSDRVELVARWVVLLLVLTTIPVVLAFGSTVADAAAQRGAEARATRHQVTATLVAAAPGGVEDPAADRGRGVLQRAPVRWSGRDGISHVGSALAASAARPGDTTVIWVDEDDRMASRPPDPDQAALAGVSAALGGLVMVVLGAAVLLVALRRVLDRGRLAAWQREWEVLGPLGRGSPR